MLHQLPSYVLENIVSLLSFYDVILVESVCKSWNSLCSDTLWKSLCAETFLLFSESGDIYGGWKAVFLWKDKYYKKIQQQATLSPIAILRSIPDSLNSLISKNYNLMDAVILSPSEISKLRSELYVFLGQCFADKIELSTTVIETNINKGINDNNCYTTVLWLYKQLYLAMTLKNEVTFRAVQLMVYSSPLLLELAFACGSNMNSEVLMLTTSSCYKSLHSNQPKVCVLAANYMARIAYFSRISECVVTEHILNSFIITNHNRIFENLPLLQSKIFISLLGAAARVDNLEYHIDMGEKLPTFFKTIKIDFTVALPLVNYVCRYLTICGEDAKMVMSIVKTVISLYNKIPDQQHYYYHGIPHPWLRVKIFQFFQLFSPTSNKLNDFISDIANLFYNNVRVEMENTCKNISHLDPQAINSVLSVFLEFINLVLHQHRFERSLIVTIEDLLRKSYSALNPKLFYPARILLKQKMSLIIELLK